MPWRSLPRAAWAIGLSCTLVLGVAAGLLRAPQATPDPSPQNRLAGTIPTINETLTTDAQGCAGVRSTEWHPLSGVEYTGRLLITMPPASGASMVLVVGDSVPLDIHVETEEGRSARVSRERLQSGPGVGVPPDFWLDDSAPWKAPQEITRLVIEAPRERVRTFSVLLGRRAPRVLARLVDFPPEARARVCASPATVGEPYFATGWYAPEGDGTRVRWMREHGAVIVGSAGGGAARVRLRAAPAVSPDDGAGSDGSTVLVVRVNDVLDLPPVTMRGGMHDYEWVVPDAAWVPGTNELFLTVSRTVARGTRRLGLALASLHVE